jgi:hypothetical protein
MEETPQMQHNNNGLDLTKGKKEEKNVDDGAYTSANSPTY